MDLREYDVVRVTALEVSDRYYDGTEGVRRPPAVGDHGTVVHVFPGAARVTVESVNDDGATLWLADFSSGELEPIGPTGTRPQLRGPDVEAVVSFLPTSSGGRAKSALSGYRPAHLVLDDYLTTGEHRYIDTDHAAPGETVRALITFITPEAYPNSLWVNKVIAVQEGSWVVGHARIVKILNPLLRGAG
jgi:elongation factor Tu